MLHSMQLQKKLQRRKAAVGCQVPLKEREMIKIAIEPYININKYIYIYTYTLHSSPLHNLQRKPLGSLTRAPPLVIEAEVSHHDAMAEARDKCLGIAHCAACSWLRALNPTRAPNTLHKDGKKECKLIRG